MSILHEAGYDKYGYDQAYKGWLPVQTVETVLLSVLSMLASPNCESAANVVAPKEWRENPGDLRRRWPEESQMAC